MEEKIETIFGHYLSLATKKPKLTERRKRLISKCLEIISHDQCILIIDYIFKAEEQYASYMRDNGYTTLESILRPTKLHDKLEKATAWNSRFDLPDDDFGWEIR